MLKNRDSKERNRECMMTKKNFFQEFLTGHFFLLFYTLVSFCLILSILNKFRQICHQIRHVRL